MLFMLPKLMQANSYTHSCRRCGLRLAVATSGLMEYGYTVPVDVDDGHFVPAPDDWRPDLARLPGGMRVAKSPLGPPPEISEREMKQSDMRFAHRKPLRRLKLLADGTMSHIVRCVLADDENGGGGDAEVLYEIHASNIRGLGSFGAPDGYIKVEMRAPPTDSAADRLPAYSKKPTDDAAPTTHEPSASSSSPVFTQACRFQLFSTKKRKYSTVMYLPSIIVNNRETAYINPVSERYRTFFWAGKPIWRWQSSQGALLWMSRRYRDAEMQSLETRLCLTDDYDQLLAVLDGWAGLSMICAVDGSYSITGYGAGLKTSTLVLYADLDAQLLGEVLGSLGAMMVQINRVTTELKKEADERRSKIT